MTDLAALSESITSALPVTGSTMARGELTIEVAAADILKVMAHLRDLAKLFDLPQGTDFRSHRYPTNPSPSGSAQGAKLLHADLRGIKSHFSTPAVMQPFAHSGRQGPFLLHHTYSRSLFFDLNRKSSIGQQRCSLAQND